MQWLNELDQIFSSRIATLGWAGEASVRLLLAVLFGGLVGIEREVRGRQAGFRTNLLVCLGSTLAMLVSIHYALHDWPSPRRAGVTTVADPARIAYGIMSGIGFLGAGAIIRTGPSVHGLTTAAGLWCVAAIGLATGFGMYLLAAVATLLVLCALWVLDYVEEVIPKVHYRTIRVRRAWEDGCIGATVDWVKSLGLNVDDASYERTSDLRDVDISLRIAFLRKRDYYNLEARMQQDGRYHLMAASWD